MKTDGKYCIAVMLCVALNSCFIALAPLALDDYRTLFELSGNWLNMFPLVGNYYFFQGGRLPAHFFTCSLVYSKALHFLMTPLVFGWALHSSCRIIWGTAAGWKQVFSMYAMLWFFLPAWGSVCCWATGSGTYLYSMAFVLCFLERMLNCYESEEKRYSKIDFVFLAALGLFAGCSNENTGILTVFWGTAIYFLSRRNRSKCTAYIICGTVCAAIGYLVLISAPGNFIRYGSEKAFADYRNYGLGVKLLLFAAGTAMINVKALPLWGLICFAAVRFVMNMKKAKDDRNAILMLAFSGLAILAMGAFIVSPLPGARTYTSAIWLLIIGAAFAAKTINFKPVFFSAVFIVAATFSIVNEMRHYIGNFTVWQQRKAILNSPEEDVSLPPPDHSDVYCFVGRTEADISFDAEDWQNKYMAAFYNKKSVRRKGIPEPESKWINTSHQGVTVKDNGDCLLIRSPQNQITGRLYFYSQSRDVRSIFSCLLRMFINFEEQQITLNRTNAKFLLQGVDATKQQDGSFLAECRGRRNGSDFYLEMISEKGSALVCVRIEHKGD